MKDEMRKGIKLEELQPNKIYSISYAGGTHIVGRYKGVKQKATEEHTFYDCLHYWYRHENFYQEKSILLSEADEIRPASIAEKRLLTGYEIEHNLI